MVKFCCITSCNVSGDGVDYFKFPVSKSLRAAWLAACGAAGDAVCSAHFADDDYKSARGARRLIATAVPSVGLPKKASSTTEKESNEQPPIPPTETATETSTKTPSKSKKKGGKKKKKKTSAGKETEKTNVDETVDKEKVKPTEEKEEKEKEKVKTIDNKEGDKSQGAMCVKENGKVDSTEERAQIEENDIEEMITNYQIQTKSLDPEPLEELIPSILSDDFLEVAKCLPNKPIHNTTTGEELDSATMARIAKSLAGQLNVQLNYPMPGVMGMNPMSDLIELDPAPVFIEVPVEERGGSRAASPEDCLMVLESVQCDVDPGSLMPPDSGSDMEILDVPDGKPSNRKKKAEAISLLTSSDEDEVIFQEPKIDTVEVSDETDEDDRPLLTLIKKPKPKPIPKPKRKSVFGMYQYYCEQCAYKTDDESHFKKHNLDFDHSTPLQVCTFCSYTTASKVQFSRHKRKHKDERNYKCHFCNYKARHNMSLIYHLKSHTTSSGRLPKFTCEKCGFYSDVKAEGLNHIKTCRDGRFLCDSCDYSTKRKSDLKRHMRRRHNADDDDEDFTM